MPSATTAEAQTGMPPKPSSCQCLAIMVSGFSGTTAALDTYDNRAAMADFQQTMQGWPAHLHSSALEGLPAHVPCQNGESTAQHAWIDESAEAGGFECFPESIRAVWVAKNLWLAHDLLALAQMCR